MKLKELLEILNEHVELIVYDKDGLRTMHLYDKNYFYDFHEEFLKKKVICIKPYENKNYSSTQYRLAVYLEDYCDSDDQKEEI